MSNPGKEASHSDEVQALIDACTVLLEDIDACYPEGTEALKDVGVYIEAIRDAVSALAGGA